MARLKLTPKDPDHEVIVGWDRMLDTYFIQVWPPKPEDPCADHEAFIFQARWTPQQVVDVIDEYAVDDEGTRQARDSILAGQDPGGVKI